MGTILEWTAEFELGVTGVDAQHRELVELVNRLRVCMGQCIGREEISDILAALVRHTEEHFGEEERMMADAGYPALSDHRANHQAFACRIRDIRRRHHEGQLIEFSNLTLIRGWLVEHMQRADRDFGDFLDRQRQPRRGLARLLRRRA